MRIAYIVSGHFGPISGAGLTIWSLVKHISRRHRVSVYADSWERVLPEGLEMHQLLPGRSYPPRPLDFFLPLKILHRYLAATALSAKIGPALDVLHIYNGLAASPHLLISQLMCQKAVMAERKKESLCSFFSQQTPKHRLLLWQESHVYRNRLYRRLLPASVFEKEQILDHYPLPPEDIIPVYGGVDFDYYNPPDRAQKRKILRERHGFASGDLVALFVGYDFRRKGLPHVIRAMPMIDERVKLLAVGGTGGMSECQKLTAGLGLEKRVIFTGPVYRNSGDYFSAADFFIFPTLFDPFGTAALEAMAAGLPIIISKRVGVAELITPGREGFILNDPMDQREIAALANRLVEGDLMEPMVKAAQETARKHTWEQRANELIALYERL